MKHDNRTLAAKGFTLIELLLYTVIIGTLLLAIVGFYGMAASARVKNQSIDEVNRQGIATMNIIMQTIRNANTVTAPAAGAGRSSLTVTVPTAALSPTVVSQSGTSLQIAKGTGGAVPLTNSRVQVSGFTVRNLTRSGTHANVQVSFTLTRVNSNDHYEFDYQKTFTSSAELQW